MSGRENDMKKKKYKTKRLVEIIDRLYKLLQRKKKKVVKKDIPVPVDTAVLFDRCVDVICGCISPEQRRVACRYVELVAKRCYPLEDDGWDREMYIKGIFQESLNSIFAVEGR